MTHFTATLGAATSSAGMCDLLTNALIYNCREMKLCSIAPPSFSAEDGAYIL